MTKKMLCAALVSAALADAGLAAAVEQNEQSTAATPPEKASAIWQFGAFVDGAYANDFNSPANHLFRSRGTTPRVDETAVNMAAAYLRKAAAPSSRWGLEVTA